MTGNSIYKMKLNRLISYIISSISFGVAIFIFINSSSIAGYEYYFLVPLCFSMLCILCRNNNYVNMMMVGPFIINITMVIRYVILPFVACLGGYYYIIGRAPGSSDIEDAIFLTLYEMVIVCLYSNYLSGKYSVGKFDWINNNKQFKSGWLYLLIVLLGIITVVLIPEAVEDQRFILNQADLQNTVIVNFPLAGLFKTVVNFARYCAVLLIINACYKRELNKPSIFNIIISFGVILLNTLYISNLSRFSLVIPLIVFTVILLYLYNAPNQRKFIMGIFASAFLIALSYTSFLKFFGEGRGDEDNAMDMSWWGDTLNAYFMGIKEMAIGLNNLYLIDSVYGGNGILLLLNDSFSNISALSGLTISSITSTQLYNLTYFGSTLSNSHIVPNICNGVYYFGYIFSPIWTCIFIFLAHWFSRKIYTNDRLDRKFAYIYAAIWSGTVFMVNGSMIISNIVNVSLLFLLMTRINRIFLNR